MMAYSIPDEIQKKIKSMSYWQLRVHRATAPLGDRLCCGHAGQLLQWCIEEKEQSMTAIEVETYKVVIQQYIEDDPELTPTKEWW